jgi:hypothetical protein
MMSEKLEKIISNQSISSPADSLVRILVTPLKAARDDKGLMVHEADYGQSFIESFASYDRDTSSWKMSQPSLCEDWIDYSWTWPKAGTMRNGTVFPLRSLAHRTEKRDSFLLLTPVKSDGVMAHVITSKMEFRETRTGGLRKISNQGHNGNVGLLRLLKLWTGKYPRATFVAWMMGFAKNWTQLPPTETQ